ncbi:Exosome RNA helicase MTR4 [Blomia tropicalis]|nr:Exosome RNA helicase MTR4 [Blomia tropicalis]
MDLFDVFDLDSTKRKSSDAIEDDNEANEGDIDNNLLDQLVNSAKKSRSEVDTIEVIDLDSDEEYGEKLEQFTPRVTIHELDTKSSCLHEVVIPTDLEYVPLRDLSDQPNFKPAKEYKFILDPFQKEAVLCIENNQSVLVSAHTSAGKTVVAEYAIASSLKGKQRVIYTTPIKALSNQKYREFQEEFEDVGLITGDVTINPTASCLIMTTEILRLMLFRGSEVMREVGWVIFDEIHYMRDRERGVIWEETIILLPDTVHYVFLSATIPNARHFAEWIAHLHHQTCHVVYTDFRPTPLQHYIYPSGGDGLHLVLDEQNNFREDNFNLAMNSLANAGDSSRGDSANRGRRGGLKDDSNCLKVIRTIMERNLAPVIIFSFSRKECEAYALQISKLEFNSAEEKTLVEEVFNNAIDVLNDDDKKLPQVQQILPLLRRGVGIHHSGLLPLIKETIEILFGEGLIKALFATETFAMGLNMPARTVVFTNARKFDGTDFRWLTSGEYIQMSGRAGRRGIDDRGIVILMIDEKMSPTVGKELIRGKPDPINSAFHLTYNMVLNLLRVEEVNPEYMLEHSFFQFQHYLEYPKLREQFENLKLEHDRIKIKDEGIISKYIKIKDEITRASKEFLAYLTTPRYILPFLNPGRILKIVSKDGIDLDWGVLINFKKLTKKEDISYTIDVLLPLDKSVDPSRQPLLPPPSADKCEMKIVQLELKNVTKISAARVFLPEDLRPHDNRQSVLKSMNEIRKRLEGIPLLDPIEDMKIKDSNFLSLVKRIEKSEKKLEEFKSVDSSSAELYEKKMKIQSKMEQLKVEMKKTRSLLQMDELKCRKRVLRRLGYCTSADVIEIKGRVACEISSGDELLLTEMLFNGAFNDLNVYQIGALLSCFVWEEKTQQQPKLTEELSKPLKTMQELAKKIATVSKETKLEIDEQTYIEKFRPNLMDVIYAWTKGQSFGELCKMTDAFEGSIIRCMRRLEELLRQMCQASKVIGNSDLENKFSEAIKLIKRDIVFAASLYL